MEVTTATELTGVVNLLGIGLIVMIGALATIVWKTR